MNLLIALVLAVGTTGPAVEASAAVVVENVEEGEIHFEPVTPEVVVPGDYTLEAVLLNGEPYDGDEIAEQGFHALRVTVADEQGRESISTTHFIVLDSDERGPVYTVDLIDYQVERWTAHPHVQPTASADEDFVLGESHGWPEDPEIPPHSLYGFRLTDPDATHPKLQVVIVGGNHPREQTGNWGLHGALDFLLSDDPRAEQLRRRAVFYVYPMVNPDGRYIVSGRSNPEMLAEGISDHNRVWHTSGEFSTIDIFVEAIQADTGGSADYLFDYHSAGSTFFYTSAHLMDSPYAQAMTAREPDVRPRLSSGHPGMTRIWAATDEGLGVPFSYTPEFANSLPAERALEIGRSYVLTFYDLISGEAALAAAAELLQQSEPDFAFTGRYRESVRELRGELENLINADGDPVEQVLPAGYELFDAINTYRTAFDSAQSAKQQIASAEQRLAEPGLTLATWIEDALAEQAERLTDALGGDATELGEVEEFIENLEVTIDAFRYAQSAEEAVEQTRTLVGEPAEGFALLYQNAVHAHRADVKRLLEGPATTGDRLREQVKALDRSVARFAQVQTDEPIPPVEPVSVESVPEVVEWQSDADWKNGLLVNVDVEASALMTGSESVLAFDGDGAHVETGFHPGESALGQSFTWEFLKRYRAFEDDTGSSGSAGTGPRFYTQLTGSNGGLRAAFGDSYWTATTLEEADRWYHIAFVYDEGEVRTYVDGELRDTRTDVAFTGDSSTPFSVGRGFDGERFLDGFSREHRIWNTARTGGEIRRNRHRVIDGSEENLVGYWPLDEASGDTAYDRSAAENHGSIRQASPRARMLPGYRISQPVAVGEQAAVEAVRLNWEAEGDTDDGPGVRISVGVSGAATSLPRQWHRASSGEPLAFLEDEDTELAGKYLWIKQKLRPGDVDTPVRLRRLTLHLDD